MKPLKYLSVAVAAGLILASCNHKFDNYDDNPNDTEIGDAIAASLLEPVIYNGVDGFLYRTWQLNGELMQYTVSGTSTNSFHRYMISNGVTTSAWNNHWRWAGNAAHMADLAERDQEPDMQAIALTLKVWFMANLTDIYGDIPYYEALKAWELNTTPKYDPQQTVYTELLNDLETANSLYTGSNLDVRATSKDILFGGDAAKWRKLTNSLHLRLLMRLSNRDREMDVAAKLAEIISNPATYPIIESREEAAVLRYTGITPFTNRYGSTTADSFNGRRMAAYLVTLMDETRDPRLSIYGVQQGSQWTGMESGMPTQETSSSGAATLNKPVLGDYASPYAIIKYDEILFIKAEAAHRGWIAGGTAMAEQYYNQAILESIEYWDEEDPSAYNITQLQKDQFLANVPYEGQLSNILLQKYVAMFWVGYESWHDYRRTGYPDLPIGTGTANNGILPRRFPYPVNTATTNPDNYQEVVARMRAQYIGGGDNMTTPVWWSQAALELATN